MEALSAASSLIAVCTITADILKQATSMYPGPSGAGLGALSRYQLDRFQNCAYLLERAQSKLWEDLTPPPDALVRLAASWDNLREIHELMLRSMEKKSKVKRAFVHADNSRELSLLIDYFESNVWVVTDVYQA